VRGLFNQGVIGGGEGKETFPNHHDAEKTEEVRELEGGGGGEGMRERRGGGGRERYIYIG
jgi:hypothetical protein